MKTLIPGLQDRATINNINYTNNINDDKLQLIKNSNETSSFLGLKASVEKESVSDVRGTAVAQAILPFNMKSLKIDLFDNANHEELLLGKRQFKVALNIITSTGKQLTYRAGMNSELRHYKRGVKNQNSTHYKKVKHMVEELKYPGVEDLRLSKFYRNISKNKNFGHQHKSMQDMSCIMHQTPYGYYFYIVICDEVIQADVMSGKGVSAKQQQAGCIATWHTSQSTNNNYEPGYALDDLLDE